MPLDKLVERILSDARADAEKIIGDAQAAREKALDDARGEAELIYDRIIGGERRAAEDDKKQRVTMAGLEARKRVLAEKQALIKAVFDSAVRAVVELPVGDYTELMVNWLLGTGKRDGELIMSVRDHDRVSGEIVARANEESTKEGGEGAFTLSGETREISGGFILRSGGIEINNSLEALIHARREELEPGVVEILFGDGVSGGE